jgi:hypothetical protein
MKESDLAALANRIADAIGGRIIAMPPLGGLQNASTKDLVDELARRGGVTEETIHPNERYALGLGRDVEDGAFLETIHGTGPARILVVTD